MLSVRSGLKLAEILWPQFVERDGVILLAHVQPPEPPPGSHRSLSEYERFHGHAHIQDLFRWDVPTVFDSELELERPDPTSRQHIAAWSLTKRVAEMWFAKLQRDFPAYRFRVYATRLDDPIVHFHRVRRHEDVWLSDADAASDLADDTLLLLDSDSRARDVRRMHANWRWSRRGLY